ncbi:trypsin-like serine protease [Shewanella frigidimarina]|uniref:trypsin-like serine protease n=1 Tax=Shewanella frigidimarina TaxID=56812 RepID=UPI003D7BDF5D
MKKTLLVLSLISCTSTVFAIEGGVEADWSKNDDVIYNNCTGTVIAGNWVLSASHCQTAADTGINTKNSGHVTIASVDSHPEYLSGGVDIALWKLNTLVDTTNIHFLSMRNVNEGEFVDIVGFGETAPTLNKATLKTRTQYEGLGARRIMMDTMSQGNSLAGDSGAPFLDSDNMIVGVLAGGGDQTTDGTRLHFAQDWILEKINGWHYPTVATTPSVGGTVIITVQSLYQDSFMDNATASGDATITGGTCSGVIVDPYDICTYEVSSNGYEGFVTLDSTQKITINKGRVKPVSPPQTTPETGSSGGGALGFLSLIGLFGVSFIRRK